MSTKIHIFGGNIGIGTDDPGSDSDLFVNGNLKTNNLTIGSVTNAYVPYGTIALWYDALVDIPAGWAHCNGTNGTPDLRDSYIKCVAGSVLGPGQLGPGQTAGEHNKTLNEGELPAHTHSCTDTQSGEHTNHNFGVHNNQQTHQQQQHSDINDAGSHTHNTNGGNHAHTVYGDYWISTATQPRQAREANPSQYSYINVLAEYSQSQASFQSGGQHNHSSGQSGSHSHSGNIGQANPQQHSHTITFDQSPAVSSFELEPPYHVLAWIMKI